MGRWSLRHHLKQCFFFSLFFILLPWVMSLNILFAQDDGFYDDHTTYVLQKMPPIFTDPILKKWPNHVLSGMAMSAAMGREIAHGIDQNPDLKSLELCRCSLTDNRILPILAVLKHNTSLHHLDISFNNFHQDTARQLSEMLSHNQTLISLSMAGCDFSDRECEIIFRGLSKNKNLKKLDMSHMFFTRNRAEKLAESMAQHPTIESIILKNCWLTSTMIGALSTGIVANASLRMLDLSGNPEISQAIPELATLIVGNPRLNLVKLNNCRLYDQHLINLAAEIRLLKDQAIKPSFISPTTFRSVLSHLSAPFFASPLLTPKKAVCEINVDGNCLTAISLDAIQNALQE